jgi:hypothetical protein
VFADPEPLLPEPVPVTGSLFHGPDDDDEPDLASLELFTIGEMATQVGRTDKTLKTWEKNGWLPHSRYTIAHSGIVQGRRLYTERQVQAVIDAMEASPASLAEMGEMTRSAWAAQGALAVEAPELGPADDDDTDVIRISMTGPSPAGSHDAWSVLVP